MELAGPYLLLDPADVPAWLDDETVEVRLLRVSADEIARLLPLRDLSLSVEEADVAELVADGISPSQIARRLHLSRRTVYRRIARLKEAFEVDGTKDLAARLTDHFRTNGKKGET